MNIYQLMLEAQLNFSKKHSRDSLGREHAIIRIREKFLATSKRAFVGIDDNGDMWISSKPQTKSELYGWGVGNGYCGEFVGTIPASKIASWCDECHEVHLSAFDEEFSTRCEIKPMSRESVRAEHAKWSDETFGDVGPVGTLKHLAKEAIEAAQCPDDIHEWADMYFLLYDAQRRAGISDEDITAAMIEKLEINKRRIWPDPKDGEPRHHVEWHDLLNSPALAGA